MRTDFFRCLDLRKFLEQSFRRVLDPCVGIGTLNSIGQMRGLFQNPRIERFEPVVDTEDEFPLPLADRMLAPERRFFPKLFPRVGNMKFVKRTDVNKVGVFARHPRGVRVFFPEFVGTAPLAEPPDRLLIRSANGIFEREASAQDERTQVIAKIELMPALRQPAYKTIRAPILADRSKVRKAAGQIFGKILRSRFVTPDDVPLRIRIIGIFHGPPILLANIGARRARLPRAHGKRTGRRLDESALQTKTATKKTNAVRKIRKNGRTLRFRKRFTSSRIARSCLRSIPAHFGCDQKGRDENENVRQVDKKIRLQRDLIQMGDKINDYVD